MLKLQFVYNTPTQHFCDPTVGTCCTLDDETHSRRVFW